MRPGGPLTRLGSQEFAAACETLARLAARGAARVATDRSNWFGFPLNQRETGTLQQNKQTLPNNEDQIWFTQHVQTSHVEAARVQTPHVPTAQV